MQEQFSRMVELYAEWNARINVVSRRDVDHLYLHHIVHSLAIAQAFKFVEGTTLLDVGTGGGFPGVPLAVALPHCELTLIDGTGKKILVANEVIKALGLKNVRAVKRRAEEEHGKYDFVVSRAVMPLKDLERVVRKNISPMNRNAQMNGIITLKGGNVESELAPFGKRAEVEPVSHYFEDDWFKEKYIIYLPC